MKKILSISLLFIMMGFSFIQIGVFLEYVVDIEAYTEKYCVNRSTPEKKCNGKCHLTEELAKNEEQQRKNDIHVFPEIVLFKMDKELEVSVTTFEFTEEHLGFGYKNVNIEEPTYPIFAPPKI